MQVIPVAGYDCMLLNLSGAHSPSLREWSSLRNAGRIGVGEVPAEKVSAKHGRGKLW